MPLQRLEPCGSKDPCTVLRGLGAGNRVWLPDESGMIETFPPESATLLPGYGTKLSPSNPEFGRSDERSVIRRNGCRIIRNSGRHFVFLPELLRGVSDPPESDEAMAYDEEGRGMIRKAVAGWLEKAGIIFTETEASQ